MQPCMNEQLLVSVSVITYNHERFIVQALESILIQKVNFKYEVIIGDDCSTDNTRKILEEYAVKYPDRIKLILHEKKGEGIPGKLNFISTIEAARGKYIALLDGDDFWTDESKLQKQVDFLEKNPGYSICFHKASILYDGTDTFSYRDVNKDTPASTSLYDLIKGN